MDQSNGTHSNSLDIVNTLYHKYKDNEYVLRRLHTHISNLPNTLENEAVNYERRQNLNAHLSEELHIFVQVFLSVHNYYYLANNNCYYEYNGSEYWMVKEDDIIHKLLSAISKDKTLLQWKYRTKTNVLKQIKDRSLFSCIPESSTIRNVLNFLYPTFFPTKNMTKYFLTVLGDNILRKMGELIYIINPKMKQMVDELELISAICIGNSNITQRMITKYHDSHSYANCRLIQINNPISLEYWRENLKRNGLNLLCVCVHYSRRYGSSDQFVTNSMDEDLIRYSCMLKSLTREDLVRQFIDSFIEKTQVGASGNQWNTIEWKNLHFIWKQFLSSQQLPSVIYSNSLKAILKTLLTYEEETDSFIGVTSKYLPVCKEFIQFWNETIRVQNDHDEFVKFEHELEVDEINQLFKCWTKNRQLSTLTEDTIVKMITHFFSIQVIDDKFVLNVVSSAWNKNGDIEQSIEYIKERVLENSHSSLIHFDDLYNYYHAYCVEKSLKLIVNKGYFEKYLIYNYSGDICYDKFIKTSVF